MIDQAAAERWYVHLPLFVIGGASIVAGGLAAAVTRPTSWELGPWVAAFLVLVGGVGQIGLGAGQVTLATRPINRRVIVAECAGWSGGCALVIVGTVVSKPIIVAAGGAIMMIVLLTSGRLLGASTTAGLARTAYRSLLAILSMSIPIGLALSWLRH